MRHNENISPSCQGINKGLIQKQTAEEKITMHKNFKQDRKNPTEQKLQKAEMNSLPITKCCICHSPHWLGHCLNATDELWVRYKSCDKKLKVYISIKASYYDKNGLRNVGAYWNYNVILESL